MRPAAMENIPESYLQYTQRKIFIICLLILLTVLLGIYAINAGSAQTSPIIIWNIRLPRILAAITAGVGLSVAGCVRQNMKLPARAGV